MTTECLKNTNRLISLAWYGVITKNKNTLLGTTWNVLNPLLQIIVYWFVFSIGLRSSSPKGGYPHIIWMITGIVPWFYMSEVLNDACSSIYAFSSVLKRMNFPLSIVPIKTLLTNFITHLFAMAIVIVLVPFYGAQLGLNLIYLLYFMICSFAFLTGYALLMSAISTVVRDVQKLMSSVIRLLFYVSPILWVQDGLPEVIKTLLKLNPFDYLINGYRDSLLYYGDINLLNYQTLYFWVLTVILFAFGCKIHVRFKNLFFDLI